MTTFTQKRTARTGRIGAAALALLAALLAAPAASAQTTNEFWIGPNAILNPLGSLLQPFDGSTAAKFDAVLNALPTNATLHILAGVYQTQGSAHWLARSGQKLLGGGMWTTILQLQSGAADGSCVVGNDPNLPATYIEVQDMTVDCNYTAGSVTYDGVNLVGDHIAVRRVRVINLAGLSATMGEAHGIAISTALADSDANMIEQCEVAQFRGGAVFGAYVAATPLHWINAIVQNNRFYLAGALATTTAAISASSVRNYLVEANYVEGATTGVAGVNGAFTNLVVTHNAFKSVAHACSISGGASVNLSFLFNVVELTNDTGGGDVAFQISAATNVSVTGNMVMFEDGDGPGAIGKSVQAANVSGLLISQNKIDSVLTAQIDGTCSGVTTRENFDLVGNPLDNLSPPQPLTTAALNVVGTATVGALTITNGATNGAVLVSDGSGNASWQTLGLTSAQQTNGAPAYNEQTLTGAPVFQLSGLSARVQHLTPSGGDQVVKLPALTSGAQFLIANMSPTWRLIIEDANGSLLTYLPPNWHTFAVAQSVTWDLESFTKNAAVTFTCPGILVTNRSRVLVLTAPPGFSFIVTSLQVATTFKTGTETLGAMISLGSSTVTNNIIANLRLSPAAASNTFQVFSPKVNAASIPTGSSLTFCVVQPATGPKGFAQTVTADVTGYFR